MTTRACNLTVPHYVLSYRVKPSQSFVVTSDCNRHDDTAELPIGPFCVNRSNPTHQLTDPTQPNPLQVEKFEPDPIQLTMKLTV